MFLFLLTEKGTRPGRRQCEDKPADAGLGKGRNDMSEKQPEASVAIQVLPDVEGEEVIRVVDEVIDYIKSFGLNTYVGPFETTIEGDYDQLMEIVKGCQEICIKAGAPSVKSYVKIFFNPKAGVWTIDKKIAKHHQ